MRPRARLARCGPADSARKGSKTFVVQSSGVEGGWAGDKGPPARSPGPGKGPAILHETHWAEALISGRPGPGKICVDSFCMPYLKIDFSVRLESGAFVWASGGPGLPEDLRARESRKILELTHPATGGPPKQVLEQRVAGVGLRREGDVDVDGPEEWRSRVAVEP